MSALFRAHLMKISQAVFPKNKINLAVISYYLADKTKPK
jgi:hypothetical protein